MRTWPGRQAVYLKGYQIVPEARAGIGSYFRFYNGERPHQALGYRTPEEVFEGGKAVADGLAGPPQADGNGGKRRLPFVTCDSGCLNPAEILPLALDRLAGSGPPETWG